MSATITVTAADHTYTSAADYRTAVKAGLAGIGVTSGQIQYDSGSHVICKISNGSGTYADNFIRFEHSGHTTYAHSMQMGTGYSSGTDVTGGGLEQAGFYASATKKHRYIKADDGTFGVVQILNSATDLCEGSYGFIKPTNTTQTAANIPLVMGLGSFRANAVQTGIIGAGFDAYGYIYTTSYGYLRYWDSTTNTYVNINSSGNMRVISADVKKGGSSYDALGSTVTPFTGYQGTSNNYFGQSVYSVAFGLHNNISGNLPIVPNVPVMSGGVPIGYNSNLVFCPPNLNPGDNIIITAGSEEYTVITSDGIAIRRV